MLRTKAWIVFHPLMDKRLHLSPLLRIAYASVIAQNTAQALVRSSPGESLCLISNCLKDFRESAAQWRFVPKPPSHLTNSLRHCCTRRTHCRKATAN
jgi:hypothetical protein